MRVFITGIEGFVGQHLAALLSARGDDVSGSVFRRAPSPMEAVVTEGVDVRDRDRVCEVIESARPDVVVHLAGQASVAESFLDPVGTFEVNVRGALSVLEASRALSVDRTLLVTSCEVYGDPDPGNGRLVESAPLEPINPYGASKAAQDMIGYQYWRSFGIDVVRARPFPHTGPGQLDRYLFPSVARRIALAESGRGEARISVGNVATTRDLLDVRDVARAYAALIEHGEPGGVYNVCRGVERSLSDALQTLCDLATVDVEIVAEPAAARPTDFDWMVGDCGAIERTTGWNPEVEWVVTMSDVLEGMRERVAAEEAVRTDG